MSRMGLLCFRCVNIQRGRRPSSSGTILGNKMRLKAPASVSFQVQVSQQAGEAMTLRSFSFSHNPRSLRFFLRGFSMGLHVKKLTK